MDKSIKFGLSPSNFWWLLFVLVASISWVIYITYYNSRILGFILTAVLNKFFKIGRIRFGSFSISVLSGKFMFRDVHLTTDDFSLRITDGWLIFRWWRPYVYKEVTEDLSHSDTRVYMYFDDFEFHVYNRSEMYSRLEKLFGLDELMGSARNKPAREESEDMRRNTQDVTKSRWQWRDLVPVIKVDIASGRFAFGNHLVPSTLCLSFEDGHIVYTTKPASTPFDQFMHITKCTAENFRAMFVPSPNYEGPKDEPPRYMGEGFVVLQSNDIDIYYYMDEAGLVPYEPEQVRLADGEVMVQQTHPCWGVDIKCGKSMYGKSTDISYGPWADRQRELLWRFFYPSDYQPLTITHNPASGEKRIFKTFDIRMSMLADATLDLLFTKNKETQAIHMNMGPGTYLESIIPWITTEEGYTTKVNGQLLHLDATTSLEFRSFVECETLEFDVRIAYPIHWNEHQDWFLDLTACKASVHLIFEHKHFILDLLDDWSDRSIPDVYRFIPYSWHFNLIVKEFELITMANEYNWIDCSSTQQENSHIAFTGEMFDLSFVLPYTDFLPPTVPVKVFIRGESVYCRLFLPESNTSRHVLLSLAENMKIMDREGNVMDGPFGQESEKQWRNITAKSHGWVDCWTTPIVALSIGYTYHPIPRLKKEEFTEEWSPITTPEKEERLLIPLKPIAGASGSEQVHPKDFDPTSLSADMINVELEVGPSVLCLYGSLLRNFLHVKENYFGEDQKFTDYDAVFNAPEKPTTDIIDMKDATTPEKPFDHRQYRPLSVTVSVTLHDIQGHLVMNCTEQHPPCPTIYCERLAFEMDKSYLETRLQLLLSPAVLIAKDNVVRPATDAHLSTGHLALSGLQFRGHAMFSDKDLPLDSETLEYAWMVEATIGDITGKLSVPQLQNIVEFLQTGIFLIQDAENDLLHPMQHKKCQHFIPQPECPESSKYPFLCPTENDIKYRMTRVSVDSVDLYVVETGAAFNVQIFPIRLSTCNLHGIDNKAGITAVVHHFLMRQYVQTTDACEEGGSMSDIWIEAGGTSMGPINIDAAMALPQPEFHEIQDSFLKLHDTKTHRLWFLWPPNFIETDPAAIGKCGCVGGCCFFGPNRSGLSFFIVKETEAEANAVFQIHPDDMDPGFGQSLLQKGQLVFDIESSSLPPTPSKPQPFMFTRGYMSRSSLNTPGTNTTIVEDLAHMHGQLDSVLDGTSKVSSTSTLQHPPSNHNASTLSLPGSLLNDGNGVEVKNEDQNSNFDAGSIPEELIPDSPMPDAYDTDRWAGTQSDSASVSLTQSPLQERRDDLHFHRLDNGSSSGTTSGATSPLLGMGAKHKKSSSKRGSKHPRSPFAKSPNVRRSAEGGSIESSSFKFIKINSIDSLTGSEHYYSADEEVSGSEDEKTFDFSFASYTTPEASFAEKTLTRSSQKGGHLSPKKPRERVRSLRGIKSPSTSSADSLSGISFESAQMSQEDLNLVDLHGQMEQPVTKSPLLMSCYTSHMTQWKCSHWTSQPPFHLQGNKTKGNPMNTSMYSQGSTISDYQDRYCLRSWIPQFAPHQPGFSPGLMITKRQPILPQDSNSDENLAGKGQEEVDTEHVVIEDPTSKTKAVVKVTGSVDVLVSPLLLEAAQRYVEAVTPTLSRLHPSAIVDALHTHSADKVIEQNRLKKKKSAHESAIRSDEDDLKMETEEVTSSKLEILVSISKINLSIVQASLVEEVIAFSALDNIKDITCVSLLAVCLDSISGQVMISKQSKRRLEVLGDIPDNKKSRDNVVRRNQTMKSFSLLTQRSQSKMKRQFSEIWKPELIEESTEIQQDESLGIIQLSRIHCQLRRLRKNYNVPKDVRLTAIPEYKSKVLFTFQKELHGAMAESTTTESSGHQRESRSSKLSDTDDPAMGFVMVEFGLDDIRVRAIKRTGFKDAAKKENEQDISKDVSEKFEQMQKETKFTLETEERASVKTEGSRKSAAPSQGHSEKDDVSYQSMICRSSSQSDIDENEKKVKEDTDATCCVLQFNTVWFSFAAPPPMPTKKRPDFTRLDWNLLSTATPAFNAWLSPCDHLIVSVQDLVQGRQKRVHAVLACIMTDALDVQGIHLPAKSKFKKITSLSHALQHDPSCQLLSVLRRYIAKVGVPVIEEAVNVDTIPQAITLQKGILALTRQWKNVLYMYMPQLLEARFKNRKNVRPYTVSFAIPKDESMDNLNADDADEISSLDNFEIMDERMSLLPHSGGSPRETGSLSSLIKCAGRGSRRGSADHGLDTETETASLKNKKTEAEKRKPWKFTHADSPVRAASNSQAEVNDKLPAKHNRINTLQRNESNISFVTASDHENHDVADQMGTPIKINLSKKLASLEQSSAENNDDLYRWMAQQQEYHRQKNGLGYVPTIEQEGGLHTMVSELSVDEQSQDFIADYTLQPPAIQLAEAQILFKPLIEGVGLQAEGIKSSAIMKKFGGHISIKGILPTFKIEIVESDDNSLKKAKGKTPGKGRKAAAHLLATQDAPVFKCDGFNVGLVIQDIVDFEKDPDEQDSGMRSKTIRFAMDHLEAKPTTMQVHFSVVCESITQRTNVSLLRLVHQVVTVVENISITRSELKRNRPESAAYKTHRKTDSKGSSSSANTDTHSTGAPELSESPLGQSVRSNRSMIPESPYEPRPTKLSLSGSSSKRGSYKKLSFKKFRLDIPRDYDHSPSPTTPKAHGIDVPETTSPSIAERTIIDQINENTPKCWRNLYHLLDLYSHMPEMKHVQTGRRTSVSQLSVIAEEAETDGSPPKAADTRPATDPLIDIEAQPPRKPTSARESHVSWKSPTKQPAGTFTHSLFVGETIPLVVFGIAKVKKTRILATLSGIQLEAELLDIHASASHKEKVKGFFKRKTVENSFTAHIGQTLINLFEDMAPSRQTVVTVHINTSEGLYTSLVRRCKEHKSSLTTIGTVKVDIPQHPIALHGVMTRSTKRLSTTLQEFMRPPPKARSFDSVDGAAPSQPPKPEELYTELPTEKTEKEEPKSKPIVMYFKAFLQGFIVEASLLPSLRARYEIGKVTSFGITGLKAKFNVDLPVHSLSFNSSVVVKETNLPSSASIAMPPIFLLVDYRQHNQTSQHANLTEGLVLREGNFFNAVAEVGLFEHSLTTDVLNHLVFVQKVFMKEINEVLQKVAGGDQPVPLWYDSEGRPGFKPPKPLLYSLLFKLQGIQITATTPTASAVRLETEEIELELSNRVQTAGTDTTIPLSNANLKLFAKVQVDLNVSLGQLHKNLMYGEAEPEFQILSYFKTRIALRNALQDEMIPGGSGDQEAVIITLARPVMFVQPLAFDKAVLVWLNYKNAYEYWHEQRMALNKEVQTATQQVMDTLPSFAPATAPALGTLFLQLTIDDMGICLPLEAPLPGMVSVSKMIDNEPGAALVMTLESTQISACSCGSLVSKGKFTGFCLRFADDFLVSSDDWKPSLQDDIVMNACVVPEGTYEVCSRTLANQPQDPTSNAKMILNITWLMNGLDVHLDHDIGKRLSALGNTLTVLAGDEDEYATDDVLEGGVEVNYLVPPAETRRKSAASEALPGFVKDVSLDPKLRARLIEQEMNKQAQVVQDLRQLGASQNTIEAEARKLQELEMTLFQDFRRDVWQRLRKQSVRATALKDKLGLGYKPSHGRSKSIAVSQHMQRRGYLEPIAALSSFHEENDTGQSPILAPRQHSRTLSVDAAGLDTERSMLDVVDDEESPSKDLLSVTVDDPTVLRNMALTDSEEDEVEDEIDETYLKMAAQGQNHSEFKHQTSNPSLGSNSSNKTMIQPNIDFECDIKVQIESGQCVLHPKEFMDEAEPSAKKSKGKENRSHSLTPQDSSPLLKKKAFKKQESVPTGVLQGRFRHPTGPQPSITDITTFYLPGVDVMVNYNSKTSTGETPPSSLNKGIDPTQAYQEITDTPLHPIRRGGAIKKASIYAWVTLQKLSDEMIISPALLDFLEQALEPIPIHPQTASQGKTHKTTDFMGSVLNLDLDSSSTSLTSPTAASFPVDVTVHVRVQPSVVRFNCQPVSKVECLLQVPSLDLVFSTKRTDVEGNQIPDSTTPPTKMKGLHPAVARERQSSGGNRSRSSSGARPRTSSNTDLVINGGGLSVSLCLADFSFYIFHPYGGGQKKQAQGMMEYDSGKLGSINEHYSTNLHLPATEGRRKDSLSLNVEFVKVNISRSRKGVSVGEVQFNSSQSSMGLRGGDLGKSANVVRFSCICDIGSASFKYDMRRLTEILALPKAWYRRALARRLFLGDEPSMMQINEDEVFSSGSSTPLSPDSPNGFSSFTRAQTSPQINLSHIDETFIRTHHRRSSSGDKSKIKLNTDFRRELQSASGRKLSLGGLSPESGNEKMIMSRSPSPRSPSSVHNTKKFTSPESAKKPQQTTSTPMNARKSTCSTWETLVLFAVNLSALDVHVNMGNVMGNTMWSTKDLKSNGRFSIDSIGHKNMRIISSLDTSKLEAKGGIVGGNIELQRISTYFQITEDPGKDPDHAAGLQLYALESRLDYMGSSILMCRISEFKVNLRDEWRLESPLEQNLDTPLATKRPALIFIHGDLEWDQFHLMISKSTTPDIIKMAAKLEEYFTQQFDSSKRALSGLGSMTHTGLSAKQKKRVSQESEIDPFQEVKHHRHWKKVLELVSGCQFSMLPSPLPESGTILGGTLTLHGHNLSLACFHGINFRSKSWALFVMDDPTISFATEAQDVMQDDKVDTHIVQNLSFNLGDSCSRQRPERHMATICKVSRGYHMPPPFTSVQEWFHYAFSSSELKDFDKFPRMHMGESSSERRASRPKSQNYSHDTEIIFALPSLQLNLKTEHMQGQHVPLQADPIPKVGMSFVTEFEDHIFVAMDAEVILFLHDLVTSYIKEKDKATARLSSHASHKSSSKSPESEKKVSPPASDLQKDWREFDCKTWHLEPTVRLLSWAGRQIEPVGADNILKRLGFYHARTTIPKWMQRGFLDPLDKVLSVLMHSMILTLKNDNPDEIKEEA